MDQYQIISVMAENSIILTERELNRELALKKFSNLKEMSEEDEQDIKHTIFLIKGEIIKTNYKELSNV